MARVSQLGYLVFEVSKVEAWTGFATGVLGLTAGEIRDDGSRSFRMDQHVHRLILEPGAADDVAAIGWEVADERALADLVEQLRASGVAVREGTPAEAARRRVARLVKLTDPAGLPLELYHGPEQALDAFVSPEVRGGFVADEAGLGHVVISAESPEASAAFYQGLLGFRLSDRITCTYHGFAVDITFLHVNARHHALAIGGPQRKRIHHFMVEARQMDEVGRAFDRALAAGLRIRQTIGRHPNDGMLSFYASTPSGFQFEFGWGGRLVDDRSWVPATYDRISTWGHHPPEILGPRQEKGKA